MTPSNEQTSKMAIPSTSQAEDNQLSVSLDDIRHMDSRAEDDQLSASLDAIRHMDSESEDSPSEDSKSSSDDCCWTLLKKRVIRHPEEVYTISSTVQQEQSTSKIPQIICTSPSPPTLSPETNRLNLLRRRRIARYRETQIVRELSLDPYPRSSYVTLSRYSVHLTGFPVTQPEVTYTWLVDFCSEFYGYTAVHLSPIYKEEVFVEFSGLEEAKYAATALNGKQITENRFLKAYVTVLPLNSTRVTIMETQV